MRKSFGLVAVPFVVILASPVMAADPSISDVRATAASGDLGKSLEMMSRVLKDHPNSAKAHYVEAELYARQHDFADARTELATAQRLAPGLPFINAYSKKELSQQLAGGDLTSAALEKPLAPLGRRSSLPWGLIGILGLAVLALLFLFRQRQRANVYSAPMDGPPAYGNPVYGQPVYGPQGGPWGGSPGGSMGSGIWGGLATGAAMGAGFAAGEEVVDHLLGSDRERDRDRPIERGDNQAAFGTNANSDMGGDAFGISDDSNWDDGSSGGGGDGW